jgi:multimeric flavodoxin WrbA
VAADRVAQPHRRRAGNGCCSFCGRAGGRSGAAAAGYAGPEDILSAGGYLFVCPENLGSMTGEMKTFSTLAIIP